MACAKNPKILLYIFALMVFALHGHGEPPESGSIFVDGELPADSIQQFLQDATPNLENALCINWGPLPLSVPTICTLGVHKLSAQFDAGVAGGEWKLLPEDDVKFCSK